MKEFQGILIIGIGLIGGSLAFSLKKAGYKGEIIGYDISKASLIEAKKIGFIDKICENPKDAVRNVDLIIMAVPVRYYAEIFKDIGGYIPKNVIVTDVGSVKGYVENVATKYLPKDIQFLGGHPMAGSEKAGIRAATPSLYENAYYFLVPTISTKKSTIKKIENLVKTIGSYPIIVNAKEHDKIVAQISHIPHLTSVILVNLLNKSNGKSYIPFAGGGFRDSTRISMGNPYMWKDIFLSNKKELLKNIKSLQHMLKEFKVQLEEEKEEEILKILKDAKRTRESIPQTTKDYIPALYDLIIDIQDEVGALGKLTQTIGGNGINIKDIEVIHARQGERGAIRIGFNSKEDQRKGFNILKNGDYPLTYKKGEG